MKKRAAWILAAVLLIALISACDTSNKEERVKTKDGKVIVRFLTFEGTEKRRQVLEKIIDNYNHSQSKVYVKQTYLPSEEIYSTTSGIQADVILREIETIQRRAKNNEVKDLNEYIDDEFKQQFYSHTWEAVEYEGKAYAIPVNTDTRLLFYNKKAFEEAGLDSEKPPETWEELERYARLLDVKSGDKYDRIGFYPLWGSAGASSWMMNADNGRGFIDNGKVSISTPAKINALNWILGWRNRLGGNTVQAFQEEFGAEQANPFIAEKVAMWIDTADFYLQVREQGKNIEIGAAFIPAYKKGSKHWVEGTGLAAEIPKGAVHPKEAMELIKHLTSFNAQKTWAVKTFDIAANRQASEAAVYSLTGNEKIVYEKAVNNLNQTKIFPVSAEYLDYQSRLNPAIDNALLGNISVERALQQAEAEIVRLKDRQK